MSPEIDNPLAQQALQQAEELSARRDFDAARKALLAAAKDLRRQKQSDLAATLLQRALQYPGDTSAIWLAMGECSKDQGADAQAMQQARTGVWLAMKLGQGARVKEGLALMDGLDAPMDEAWRAKADRWLAEQAAPSADGKQPLEGQAVRVCDFCGRDDFVKGELFEGLRAAICPGCVGKFHLGREGREE